MVQQYRLVGLGDRQWASDYDRDMYASDSLIHGTGYARQRPDGLWERVPYEAVIDVSEVVASGSAAENELIAGGVIAPRRRL